MKGIKAANFALWALVGASVVAWGLRWLGSGPGVPAYSSVVANAAPARADLSRVLGADVQPVVAAAPAPAPADGRLRLVGLVAAPAAVKSGAGLASLSVDGKPARAFRVGERVLDELVLKAVQARAVELGPADGAVTVRLELPPLPPAATGVLAPASPGG
jgi:general secretion pathway protein C